MGNRSERFVLKLLGFKTKCYNYIHGLSRTSRYRPVETGPAVILGVPLHRGAEARTQRAHGHEHRLRCRLWARTGK